METEIGTHWPANLALLHFENCILQRPLENSALEPVKIATEVRRSRIFRIFLSQFGEILTALCPRGNFAGTLLCSRLVVSELDENMPRTPPFRRRIPRLD